MDRVQPGWQNPQNKLRRDLFWRERAEARDYSTICRKAYWRNMKSRSSINMRGYTWLFNGRISSDWVRARAY